LWQIAEPKETACAIYGSKETLDAAAGETVVCHLGQTSHSGTSPGLELLLWQNVRPIWL